ncbi:MAG: alpha/beta hydrolase [Candidatus Hydrogenedentota bacterium]
MADFKLLRFTKAAQTRAGKLLRAELRVQGEEYLAANTAVIVAPPAYTRLEMLLLPHALSQTAAGNSEALVWAAPEAVRGHVGRFITSVAMAPEETADAASAVVHALLAGEGPVVVLPPENLTQHAAAYPPPHAAETNGAEINGAAVRGAAFRTACQLALQVETARRRLAALGSEADPASREAAWHEMGYTGSAPSPITVSNTVVLPAEFTYYPLRPRADALLRVARQYAENGQQQDLRGLDAVPAEETWLAKDGHIDIGLAAPVDVADTGDEWPLAEACAARVADCAVLNVEHLLALLLRQQTTRRVDDRLLRNRLYLVAEAAVRRGGYLHESVQTDAMLALCDEACPAFDRFLGDLAALGQIAVQPGRKWEKAGGLVTPPAHRTRLTAGTLTHTLSRRAARLPEVAEAARVADRTPSFFLYRRVRDGLVAADLQQFEQDYARHYNPVLSKAPDVGRPFFLKPLRVRGGILLTHGYMAAPLEVRALADYLYQKGYAVYGVRMAGHGTAPDDLANCDWEAWYAAVNRGYAVLQTLTDRIVVSGFSTGGCLALMAAARKGHRVQACVPICAPLQVRNSSIRLASPLVTVNSLLKRMGNAGTRMRREYVDNAPENPHINYTKNPIAALKQLVDLMHATQALLGKIDVPTLVMQASDDPTVVPTSAEQIFTGIATKEKELTVFARERHGIINGDGCEDLFERFHHWLERLREKEAATATDPETTASAG